jgi:hypothetical protein
MQDRIRYMYERLPAKIAGHQRLRSGFPNSGGISSSRNKSSCAHLDNFTPEILGTALGLQIFHNVARADPDSDVSATWPEEFRPDLEMAVLALTGVRRDLNIPFTPRKRDPQP